MQIFLESNLLLQGLIFTYLSYKGLLSEITLHNNSLE